MNIVKGEFLIKFSNKITHFFKKSYIFNNSICNEFLIVDDSKYSWVRSIGIKVYWQIKRWLPSVKG